jgi:hypothetical membrane protein
MSRHRFNLAVAFFVTVILIAQLLILPDYVWTAHTVSELAAQGVPTAWVMQLGFLGFGGLMAWALWGKRRDGRYRPIADMLLLVYGLAIGFAGIFSTAPFISGVAYAARESALHSLFATTAGFAFSLGILVYAWREGGRRPWHFLFFLLVTGCSAAFGLSENGVLPLGRGIVQRLLYLVSFIWLLWSQRDLTGSAEPVRSQ